MLEKLLKYKFLLIFSLILLIAVSFISIKPQSKKKFKTSPDGISITLSPQNATASRGEDLKIEVIINGKNYNISAADITFEYNEKVLGKGYFIPSNKLTAIVNDSSLKGKIHYVGVNVSPSPLKESIKLGTISFKPKSPGNAKLGFSDIHINASGVKDALPVDIKNTKTGNYKIK